MAGPQDERRCPRCDAPYADGQEYCLECGERLPAGPQRQSPPEPTITAPPTPATTGATQRKPPPPLPKPKLVFWPAGKSGWTIVLDSVPATNGRTGAVAEAKQAL